MAFRPRHRDQIAMNAIRVALLVAASVLLASCANKPAAPDWELNAHAALAIATQAYLAGHSKLADVEYTRARQEVAGTGRAALVARVELARCAAHAASMDFEPCTAYAALAPDAGAPERAYAQFLSGQWSGMSAALLPTQYQGLIAATDTETALTQLEDPLSRLIAAAALLRAGHLTPQGMALAVDTASAQGWRRPLLAWLGLQAQRAKSAGDEARHAQIQRRIALILGTETKLP